MTDKHQDNSPTLSLTLQGMLNTKIELEETKEKILLLLDWEIKHARKQPYYSKDKNGEYICGYRILKYKNSCNL